MLSIKLPQCQVRAFRRGRLTRANLYHGFEYEPLLEMPVKELRERIGLAGNN